MMGSPREGIILVVVLFFAVTIGTGLFFLLFSGSSVAQQNKKTLYQLQAYYVAQAGIQQTELIIKLLPLDVFHALKKGETEDIRESVHSEKNQPSIRISASPSMQDRASFDLFSGNTPDDEFPFPAEYALEEISLEGSYKAMSGTQDGYKLRVVGKVFPFSEKRKGATSETIEETFIVSRFTEGVR